MSKIAKEKIDEKKIIDESNSSSKKKSPTRKVEQVIKNVEVSDDAKKSAKKSTVGKKSSAKSTSKESTTEKKSAAKSTAKKTSAKKSTSSKSTKITGEKKDTSKKSTRKKSEKSPEPQVQILEYYDLPYKYGNTVVKLLAQTPKTLFVYWEVSDSDIENFKKTYGDDFFSKTKPILIVHNLTLNKTNEVEINDFANCWYLNTDDSDCKFDIELGRKYIEKSTNSNDNSNELNYLSIATSNDLQSPNNHILFEKIKEFVIFRNVNTDTVFKKNIKSFKFLKDIYRFYKEMYDEDIVNNPSSKF